MEEFRSGASNMTYKPYISPLTTHIRYHPPFNGKERRFAGMVPKLLEDQDNCGLKLSKKQIHWPSRDNYLVLDSTNFSLGKKNIYEAWSWWCVGGSLYQPNPPERRLSRCSCCNFQPKLDQQIVEDLNKAPLCSIIGEFYMISDYDMAQYLANYVPLKMYTCHVSWNAKRD